MKEKLLNKVIKRYNKYRSPRATAELRRADEDLFKVQFEGSFDDSCCMDEYFFDLVYELKDEGLETELMDYKFEKGKYVATFRFEN
ncbi:MAG: hypothetical protein BAJALOKI2v1_530006 [Promethearchaeota archaeon]|nr:MAG: hypothetical protein BAJALOKI2v1_530006 [Candidatus Lokiarchaeota archaeon]